MDESVTYHCVIGHYAVKVDWYVGKINPTVGLLWGTIYGFVGEETSVT